MDVELGRIPRDNLTENMFSAPALGQVWKKGQGPLWRFDIKAQILEKTRTTASPNGSLLQVRATNGVLS